MNKDFLKAVDKLNTVIIPGLGAVIKMGKKYSFNTFLNYDDGRFVKYIQEETNITLQEAETKVNSWYSDIKSSIDTSGSFKLPGIGEIKKSNEGKLDFSLDLSSSKTSISKNNNDTKKQEKAEIQETVEIDNKKAEIQQEQEEVKKQVQQESQILNTIKQKEQEDEIDIKKAKKDSEKENSVPQFKLSDDDPDPVIKALIDGADKIEKENKRSKLSRILISSGLILFLIGGGIVGYLKYDSIMSYIKSDDIKLITKTDESENKDNFTNKAKVIEDNESMNDDDSQIKETLNNDTTITNNQAESISEINHENDLQKNDNKLEVKEDKINKLATASLKNNINNKYHPVVGTFSEIDNANKLLKELLSRGFSDASILKIDNDLNCVKLGSYKTKTKAKEILEESKLEGWVKYY